MVSYSGDKRYLMIVGGSNGRERLRNTEVLVFSNATTNDPRKCYHTTWHSPAGMELPTGGLLTPDPVLHHPVPVLCGGGQSTSTFLSKCFVLGRPDPAGSLSVARYAAASVVVNNGKTLWVTGGKSGSDVVHNSTDLMEFLDTSMHFLESNKGFKLPKSLYGHCLEKVNSSSVILYGGEGESSVLNNKTWTISWPINPSEAWINMAPMAYARKNHACGVLNGPSEGAVVVVAAGGTLISGDATDIVEFFLVGDENWKLGPSMPKSLAYAGHVTASQSQAATKLYVAAGSFKSKKYRKVFILECSIINGACDWEELPINLSDERSSILAFFLHPRAYASLQMVTSETEDGHLSQESTTTFHVISC